MSVKRINITYGGAHYSLGHEDPDALRSSIAEAIASGTPLWIEVNQGEGDYRPAHLLITRGIDIAVVAIDADDGD